ncbi:MAG TPA: DUF3788 family protein [Candidatus Cloacimonadota bacterium]|nr:DUF3788 family protein [Candidatus Cloacimonadota bacterium]
MTQDMLLRDPSENPTDEVLEKALSESFPTFQQFREIIISEPYNFIFEWRYYNDGKAWLGKIVRKKQTVCWLSVWEGFFKLTFYFHQKFEAELIKLPAAKSALESYLNYQGKSKTRPLTFVVSNLSQLSEIGQIVDFKLKSK